MNTLETWIVIAASFVAGVGLAGALFGGYLSKLPPNDHECGE